MAALTLRGFEIHKEFIPLETQRRIVATLRKIAKSAPMVRPETPYGKPMSVRLTSAGKYGWHADKSGYRYVATQPNGQPWPKIPADVLNIWSAVTRLDRQPECCLINYYGADARMGMHQDRDEADFKWPVVSISLGDEGLFRIGNTTRGGTTESIWLQSGDVVVMGNEARLTYHGIDRIKSGSSSLLDKGGRINLTLRVVD
ncbi:MAG: alpha-ketoglutarate-dependent dioxygenase AlkB [Sulfitobacter sp.]